MKLENGFQVPVPVDEAWKVLLDVERIAPCVPGATLTGNDGDTYKGTVKVKLGPIGLTYNGTVTFVSTDEQARVVVLEASGRELRGNGTAKATVTCTLVPSGNVTDVNVETELAITGKPAQFGRGALNDVAGSIIGRFASNLAEKLSTSGAQATAEHGTAPAGATVADEAAPVLTATAPAPLRDDAPAPEAEPIDLLAIAPGGRIVKLAAPAFVLGLLAVWLLRRR